MNHPTLFNDIWSSGDFAEDVDHLAHEFRAQYELPPLYQLGLAVKNVEESAAQLEAL